MRARRLALAVESQTRLILVAALDDLSVMRMSLSSSLAWGCGARPQPRSSRMPAADTRAAGDTASWPTTPASTLTHGAVCPRASERKSRGIFFRGRWATPLLLAAGVNRRVASGAPTITGMSCHRH